VVGNDRWFLRGLRVGRHLGGNADHETRAVADGAGDGDPAAEQAAEFLAERKAKTGAAEFVGGRQRRLRKIAEQLGEVGRRDADAGIFDGDLDPVARGLAVAASRQRDRAALGELGGVAQQIERRLAQLRRVGLGGADGGVALDDQTVVAFGDRNRSPRGATLFFGSDASLREIGRVVHDWKQLLNFSAVRCKKLLVCGVDSAQTFFERRRSEVASGCPSLPVATVGPGPCRADSTASAMPRYVRPSIFMSSATI